mgnify:CR=1 FL=1
MLEHMNSPDLIDLAMKASHATLVETELAYRLQHAMDEINTMTQEIAVLQAAQYLQDGIP